MKRRKKTLCTVHLTNWPSGKFGKLPWIKELKLSKVGNDIMKDTPFLDIEERQEEQVWIHLSHCGFVWRVGKTNRKITPHGMNFLSEEEVMSAWNEGSWICPLFISSPSPTPLTPNPSPPASFICHMVQVYRLPVVLHKDQGVSALSFCTWFRLYFNVSALSQPLISFEIFPLGNFLWPSRILYVPVALCTSDSVLQMPIYFSTMLMKCKSLP